MKPLLKCISIGILAVIMIDPLDSSRPPFKGRWENPWALVNKKLWKF